MWCPPPGPAAKLPPAERGVQAVPGGLVNEELVLRRAERDTGWGLAQGQVPTWGGGREAGHGGCQGSIAAGRAPAAPQGMGMWVETPPGFMGKRLGPCGNWEYVVSSGRGNKDRDLGGGGVCVFSFQFSGELGEPFIVSCFQHGVFSSFNK